MNTPKKHHFVPEVYLNNFSFDEVGNLYSLPIKSPYKNIKVKVFNKSQICYEENMYKIKTDKVFKDDFAIDPYYLEKNLFDYEEKFVSDLTTKFERKDNINILDAEKLIVTLLSFKFRNKLSKQQFSDSNLLEYSVNKVIEKLEIQYFSFKLKYGEEKFNRFLNYLREKVLEQFENQRLVSDLYNQILKKDKDGQNDNHNWMVKQMVKSKFIVFCAEQSNPFVSSDNPGFFMLDDDKVSNLHFVNAKAFAFPISPTRLLVVLPELQDNYQPVIKRINYKNASEDFISLTNNATIINSINRIFSINKEQLTKLKETHHTPFIKAHAKLKEKSQNENET